MSPYKVRRSVEKTHRLSAHLSHRAWRSVACLVTTFATTSLLGCGVMFTTGRPGTQVVGKSEYQFDGNEQTAVTYYLPKDVLEVTAQIEGQISKKIVSSAPDAQPHVETKASETKKLVAFDLSIVTVADRSKPFLMDAHSPGLFKNDSTISVSEAGLLESVNVKTTGAGGAVVQSVLKLAGTVLPFLEGIPTVGPAAQPAYEAAEGVGEMRSALIMQDTGTKTTEDATDTCDQDSRRIGIPDDAEARDFSKQYFGDRIELRYALNAIPDHLRLKREFCETLETLVKRKNQLEATTDQLSAASAPDAIRPITFKLQAQRAELDRAAAAHQAARDAINAAVAERLVKDEVGTVKRPETRKFVLEIRDIPETTEVAKLGDAPLEVGKLADIVKDLPRAKELFEKTKTIISVEAVQTLSGADERRAKNWSESMFEECNDACIYYREPVLYALKVWSVRTIAPSDSQPRPLEQLQPPEERLLLLVSAGSPTRAIDLPLNVWTKRDSAITFNARGRLVSLQRNSGSSAEDATGAVQQGLRAGVTEYETSLTSIGNINTLEQAIALQPLQEQIAIAQQQLELIKAQNAVGVASSTQQVLLDTELATIERNLVTAQQQLIAAQAQLASTTAIDATSAETTAIAQANAVLGAQIQQLKNEIELMKLRKELAELQPAAVP